MTTLAKPQTYMVTPADREVRVLNDVAAVVVFPTSGGAPGQEVTVQDVSGNSQIQVVTPNQTLLLSNFQHLIVRWDAQRLEWTS